MKNTNGIMPVNVSVWRAYFVYKSISDYITNKITDKTGINEEIFLFGKLILFVFTFL
jgi:hypothetical protein